MPRGTAATKPSNVTPLRDRPGGDAPLRDRLGVNGDCNCGEAGNSPAHHFIGCPVRDRWDTEGSTALEGPRPAKPGIGAGIAQRDDMGPQPETVTVSSHDGEPVIYVPGGESSGGTVTVTDYDANGEAVDRPVDTRPKQPELPGMPEAPATWPKDPDGKPFLSVALALGAFTLLPGGMDAQAMARIAKLVSDGTRVQIVFDVTPSSQSDSFKRKPKKGKVGYNRRVNFEVHGAALYRDLVSLELAADRASNLDGDDDDAPSSGPPLADNDAGLAGAMAEIATVQS